MRVKWGRFLYEHRHILLNSHEYLDKAYVLLVLTRKVQLIVEKSMWMIGSLSHTEKHWFIEFLIHHVL